MVDGGGSLGPTGDAALGYARRGWAVFPIRPGEKRPACAHGCLDATTDEAQIRDWWGLQPDAGVGIACGAASGGLLVLDLDRGHGAGEADGEEWVQEWQADNGPLPETLAARTGGGGVHLFYRYEPVEGEKLRGSANPRLGVDIRADGGYVVAAPTLHDSGRRYAWETDREPAWADADVMALVEAVRPRAERSTGAEPATAGGSGWGPRLDEEYPGCAEGGRNVTLHRWLCSKRGGGADDAAIERMAFAANERNVPPLADWEVRRMVQSVCELPVGHSAEWDAEHPQQQAADAPRVGRPGSKAVREAAGCAGSGAAEAGGGAGAAPEDLGEDWQATDIEGCVTKRGKLVPNAFGRELIARDHVCHVDAPRGILAVWVGDRYALGGDAINLAVLRHFPAATQNERKEVLEFVRLKAPVRRAAKPELLAFRNGVVDLDDETPTLRPMTPDDLIPNVIPHNYVEHPPREVEMEVRAAINTLANDDPANIRNLWEVAGICMLRSNEAGQCPVLLGTGGNGKSAYLKIIKEALGRDNYETLDLSEFGKTFQLDALSGKLANLGDDISSSFLKADILAYFKKVATGDDVHTDVKYEKGYSFQPYCTLVFSCNKFPDIEDTTDGMMRRLFPIEFRRTFKPGQAGYDPHFVRKMTTEPMLEAFISIAVFNLRRMLAENGGALSPNPAAERIKRRIRANSNNVMQWAEDHCITREYLDGRRINETYSDYKRQSETLGYKVAKQRTFTDTMLAAFSLGRVRKRCEPGANAEGVFSIEAFGRDEGDEND